MNRTLPNWLAPTAAAPRQMGLLPELAGQGHRGVWLTRLQSAVLVVLVWTAIGTFQAVPEMLRGSIWPQFLSKLIDGWGWALLTPVILLIDRKWTSGPQNVVRGAVVQLLLSVPFSLVHTYLAGLMQYPIAEISWSPLRNSEFAVYYFLGGWMTYCAFVGILQAFKLYKRLLTSQVELERVQRRLVESRLNALRLHLEPHFLFNTLNAISSEVVTNPALAREM